MNQFLRYLKSRGIALAGETSMLVGISELGAVTQTQYVPLPDVEAASVLDDLLGAAYPARPGVSAEAIVADLDALLAERDRLKAENAELRAALEGIEELLSKPNTDALGGMARRLGAVGIARAALAATEGSE